MAPHRWQRRCRCASFSGCRLIEEVIAPVLVPLLSSCFQDDNVGEEDWAPRDDPVRVESDGFQ